MKDYLQFVWNSLLHPTQFVDVLPAVQLVLAVICWYYIVRVFIQIYKDKHYGKK